MKALLLHWQKTDVKIALARQEWLDRTSDNKTMMGNFLQKADRQALGKYLITGELLKGEVGSVVMFSLPKGYRGSLAMDESVFQTIDFESLMKSRLKCDNIVDAAINYLRTSIQKLTENIIKKHFLIEINFQLVNLSIKIVTDRIKSLNPYTISWKNVCDYYTPRDFHKIARLCSSENTVHFAYSMNWPRHVFGASIIDYLTNSDCFKFMDAMIDQFQSQTITRVYDILDAQKILRVPFVDDPRNIVDFNLHVQYRFKWIDYFFSKQVSGILNKETQVIQEKALYNFFSRTPSTVFLAFCYNPEIQTIISKEF